MTEQPHPLWNMRDEQRQDLIQLLLKIQLHIPWTEAREKCEHINDAVKGIYDILDQVHYQSNQGCASHSAAPNEQAIRQDDREKVLDELASLLGWIEKFGEEGISGYVKARISHIQRKQKELRQQEREP